MASFDPAPVLTDARRHYADLRQPLVFRVPSIAAGLDDALTAHGFGSPQAETITLSARLRTGRAAGSVHLAKRPSKDWLEARAEMNGADAASSQIYADVLGLLLHPTVFASLRRDNTVAAIAYGVLFRDLLVIEAVTTRSAFRRQGLAREIVLSLMVWAFEEGVSRACLQVMADNVAAIPLYESLGFSEELYRYHYRRG